MKARQYENAFGELENLHFDKYVCPIGVKITRVLY